MLPFPSGVAAAPRWIRLVVVGLIAVLAACRPGGQGRAASTEAVDELPSWPAVFKSKFTSDWMQTHGTFWVNVPEDGGPASERIDLADGTRDHLCSTFHNNTPCTQLTTKGFRYLYFPEVPDCCRCCSYSAGPYLCGGPLGPQWLSNSTGNVVYEGIVSVKGEPCHKWSIEGLSSNYYFQFIDSRRPCEIDIYNYLRTPEQRADNQYIFERDTFSRHFPASTSFAVPELCSTARFCGPPVCDVGPELA